MNSGTPQQTASTSTSSASTQPGSHRKERGAIAAQACDTCRSRKQKCDEQRPQCGTCKRFGHECRYREPQPTKKDKTLVELLDNVKGLHDKLDNLERRLPLHPNLFGQPSTAPIVTNPPSILGSASLSSLSLNLQQQHHTDTATTGSAYRYVSGAHQMLGWPVVAQILEPALPKIPRFNLTSIAHEGVALVLGMDMDGSTNFRIPPPTTANEIAAATSGLDWEMMQSLCSAFFDTFNCIYPILDRHLFMDSIMPSAVKNQFNEPTSSALTYLVLALGQTAIEGVQGASLAVHQAQSGGILGSSREQHPGLALFNAARSKMGFAFADCTIENIQIHALAGVYCGACSRHLDHWRYLTAASSICNAILTAKPSILASPRAEQIQRLYWICVMTETIFNLELTLPTTGLEKLEHLVGVPEFGSTYSQEEYMANQTSQYQGHFVSQIFLRGKVVECHNILSSGPLPGQFMSPTAEPTAASFPGTVRELAAQLDQQMLLITTSLDAVPIPYPYTDNIHGAMLRTRYYLAKLVLYRPFIFKALHHPARMVQEDFDGVAQCLRACLKWPIIAALSSSRKRLIPCLLFWTQNILGALVILHLSRQVPILLNIRTTLCGDSFELEARETVDLYLEWLRDLSPVDRAAEWAWDVVSCLYHVEE